MIPVSTGYPYVMTSIHHAKVLMCMNREKQMGKMSVSTRGNTSPHGVLLAFRGSCDNILMK
jgi:hypothetical protein